MIYTVPSFYALIATGILILVIIIVVVRNYREIRNLETYKLLILLGLITIVVGVHGLLHAQLEQQYNYNPLEMILKKLK